MFQKLTTQRMLLRKVQKGDVDFVLKGLSNDVLTKYMLVRYYNLEAVKEQMKYYAKSYTTQKGLYWLMETLQTKEPIGIIGINSISKIHQKAEMGFWILPNFWQQGYITEAGKAVLNYCFNCLLLNRIEATVETENIASLATIKKLGFQHEGTFKEYEINNGKVIDLMMFALLKSEAQKMLH